MLRYLSNPLSRHFYNLIIFTLVTTRLALGAEKNLRGALATKNKFSKLFISARYIATACLLLRGLWFSKPFYDGISLDLKLLEECQV